MGHNDKQKTSLFSSKAQKVEIKRSTSSPTAANQIPNRSLLLTASNSELPLPNRITIPSSYDSNNINKSSKKVHLPIKNHCSSSSFPSFTTATIHTTAEKPQLRMSASSRFGKNLLPTWLGGHSTDENSSAYSPTTPTTPPPLQSATSSSSTSNSSILTNNNEENDEANELTNTFETLLDELNMKDGNREKLRQLPRERKLYLLQQNQHIKENRPTDSNLRKSMPTSNSSSSIFPPKALRQKVSANMKRSETSSRLLFSSSNHVIAQPNAAAIPPVPHSKGVKTSTSHRSIASSFASSTVSAAEDLTIYPPSIITTSLAPSSTSSIHEDTKPESVNIQSPTISVTSSVQSNTGFAPSLAYTPSPITSPTSPQSTRSIPERRAANYKFARRNLSVAAAAAAAASQRSKVGSMVLEFDAIAHDNSSTTEDSTAWLLLDNKTLPRLNPLTQQHQQHQYPSVSHVFPSANISTNLKPGNNINFTAAGQTQIQTQHQQSESTSLLANSYAYQSLTRKDGLNLAKSLAGSGEDGKRSINGGRDRNSPYYYVERLKSRNTTVDVLTKHLTSLRIALATANVSWINEFLSRRHGGLSALEHLLEKYVTKKQKKKNGNKLTEQEEQCLFECIKCIRVLLNTKPGLEQVLMRSTTLLQLITALFSCLTSIPLSQQQPTPSSTTTSVFRKSPSITSIGSHILPSSTYRSSTKDINTTPSTSSSSSSTSTSATATLSYKICTLLFELFATLCAASVTSYEVVLNVLSDIKGEQYRFEKLIYSLNDILSTFYSTKKIASAKTSFSVDEQQELLTYEVMGGSFQLFNAIIGSKERLIEKRVAMRSELERRGFEELLKKLNQNNLPDTLTKQIGSYWSSKKADEEKVSVLENTKRQTILQLQPDDIVAGALKAFYKEPEVYYLVVDSISELINVGQDQLGVNKKFVQDVWSVIHIFAKHLKPIGTNGDFQSALQQFMVSIQPIVGKFNTTVAASSTDEDNDDDSGSTAEQMNLVLKSANNIEDVEGLRNMVEELKESIQSNQEVTAKIRREKNELLMKVSKAQAEIKERDDRIASMNQQQQNYTSGLMTPITPGFATNNHMSTPDTSVTYLSPPPPPPPPPPPTPSSLFAPHLPSPVNANNNQHDDFVYPVVKRRNLIKRSDSHRSSRYLHPLAINLCFPDLESLQKGSTPTSPSPSPGERFHVTTATSILDDTKQPIVMKQLFWSKLPQEKLTNTVWTEFIHSNDTASEFSSGSSSSSSSSSSGSSIHHGDGLDTSELERLFKKNKTGTNGSAKSNKSSLSTVVSKKQNLVMLLEYNRANNIAIMLARIKLPYHDLRDAIWNIDDNALSIENLTAIKQYVPTKEEIEIVKEYNGNIDILGNAERFFRSIMYVPRLADRLGCMIFRRRFKYELEEILPELDIIQMAITELRSSTRFKHVLKTVLAIGNYLNSQTVRGNASGFHLDALLKMRDTRAEGEGVSNVPTLLHYLVYFLSKFDDDVVNFRQDISHLQAAAKLSAPSLFATVNSLNNSITQIKEELNMNRKKKTSDLQIDRFAEAMEEFLLEAEPIVEDLKIMTKDIEEKLRELILYYGEDPNIIKSEEFFDIISTFSNSFQKAQVEIHEGRERALKRQRQQEMLLKKRQQQQEQQQQLQQAGITSSPTLEHLNSSAVEANYVRPSEEGFEKVLRELKAGLKHGDETWQNTLTRRRQQQYKLSSTIV